MVRILGIGDNMVDKNLTTGMMYPGGQAMNIAVNTKMLGAQTGFIGPMGDDYVADHIKNTLDDPDHWYGVKFEPVLGELIKALK